MDMARGFIGFVLGLAVMVGVAFSGALDGASRWWAHTVLHRADGKVDYDPEHSRYTVTAIYQPADNGQPSCEPRYAFVNHTNRVVKFLPDGFDDSSDGYGNQNGYGNQPPGNGYVSTTPGQTNVPPSKSGSQGYDAQNYGPSNYDQLDGGSPNTGPQGYDQQSDNGSRDGGRRSYDDQDDDADQAYEGRSHDDRYDGDRYDSAQYDSSQYDSDQYNNDYPGDADNGGGECNAGVVKIVLDRKK